MKGLLEERDQSQNQFIEKTYSKSSNKFLKSVAESDNERGE